MAFTLVNRLVCAALSLLLSASCIGQSKPALTVHTPDGDITIPVATGVLGQQDAAALAELASHMTVVGGQPWGGMQAIGTITYGATDLTAYAATLSNAGAHSFRLDAQTNKGSMSIRITRRLGQMQSSEGTTLPIPPDAAMSGLFPFEQVRVPHFESSTSILDHGVASIGSSSLHRITIETTAVGHDPKTKSRATFATDFYFDPATHLLIKSTVSSMVPGTRNAHFLFVVTYGDYRLVGTSMIPFRYAETMDGEPYRTLQLSNVEINSTLNAGYFQF